MCLVKHVARSAAYSPDDLVPFSTMNDLASGDQIQASAARFLIDGGEEDAASVLLACKLEVWPSGDTWYQGDEVLEAVHVKLTGPRAAYDALNRETVLNQHDDYFGVPYTYREERAREGTIVAIREEDRVNFPPIVRPAIERAIEAVIPEDTYIKHLTVHAEIVDIDPDWREELLEIARGHGVTNQGIAVKDAPLYTWKNLRFRSKTEMKVAQALDRASVLFLPNCMARLGISQEYRVNREGDFLVCDRGKWGMLEIHGEPFHPPSRASQDHERSRLFKQHGIRVVEHYDANRCYDTPDEVVAEFLRLLTQS